jgi:hypothetical protein
LTSLLSAQSSSAYSKEDAIDWGLMFFSLLALDCVPEFHDGKIQFNSCFRICCFQVVAQNIRHNFTAFLHQRFLFKILGCFGQLRDGTGKFPYFGKRFYDCNRGLRCLVAFEFRACFSYKSYFLLM